MDSVPDPGVVRLSRGVVVLGVLILVAALSWDTVHLRPVHLGPEQWLLTALGLVIFAGGFALGRPVGRRVALLALERMSPERAEAFVREVRRSPSWYPRLGLWCGLTLGLVESAYMANALGSLWPHQLWLGPVVYGFLFGLLGFVMMAVAPRARKGHLLTPALFVFLSLVANSLLFLLLPRLHILAAMTFALGIGWRLSVILERHAGVLGPLVRRSEWVVLVAVVALAGWAFGNNALAERARASGSEPPEGARSVLLLVLDTVRAKSLSLFGYERRTTPSLEEWAADGVAFEAAFSTAPWTLPSHAGMFTGRWAYELSADWSTSLDDAFPTVAEVMTDNGYATGGFVGNLAYVSRGSGLARGFTHYEDFEIRFWQAVLSTALGRKLVTNNWIRNTLGKHELVNRKPAAHVDQRFLSWLDGQGEHPFFAFINYFDAHEPYMPPTPYREMFRQGIPEPRGPYDHSPNQADRTDWWEMSTSQVADEQALYDGAIAYIDHEIGELLDELDRRGVLDHTVVIVTADHGEHFGEQGLFMHGNNLYLPQVNVPLLILTPDTTGPIRVSESVSLRDLPNTVLDLAELDVSSPFPGSSLARFWRPPAASAASPDTMLFSLTGGFGPEETPLARGNMWAVVADPYEYILNGDGVEEMYDYRRDPLQREDLSAGSVAGADLERFRALISAPRAQHQGG